MPPWLAMPPFQTVKKIGWIGKRLAWFVKKAVAEAAAENHAGHGDPGDVIGDGVPAQKAPATPRLPAEPDEKDIKAGQVGKAVEAKTPVRPWEVEQKGARLLDEVGEEVQEEKLTNGWQTVKLYWE